MSELMIRGQAPANTSSQVDFILLDASGSMSSRWWDALDSIDSYLMQLKGSHISSHVLVASFTTGIFQYIWRDAPLADVQLMKDDPPGLHGLGTPLYDAINSMGRKMKDLNPRQAAITIITDGQENESKTNLTQAKAILDWMRAKGWQVTFLGCDFDNSHTARSLGADAKSALGTSAGRLKEATRLLAERRTHYARTGEGIAFTDDERTKFGGYLGSR